MLRYLVFSINIFVRFNDTFPVCHTINLSIGLTVIEKGTFGRLEKTFDFKKHLTCRRCHPF